MMISLSYDSQFKSLGMFGIASLTISANVVKITMQDSMMIVIVIGSMIVSFKTALRLHWPIFDRSAKLLSLLECSNGAD